MSRRKICVITGTRAEYGLLSGLMKEIQSDSDLELSVIATGMHLSAEYGNTYLEIEQDGFTIHERVPMLAKDDSLVETARALGGGTIGIADALDRIKPHLVVVLGDRIEALAGAQAAMCLKIPLAHIHGGETTEGAMDESIRHSITKMSQMHFVASDEYRSRVIQLGELPDRVFAFGAPAVDRIKQLQFLSQEELERNLGVRLSKPIFLVTYHPETLGSRTPAEAVSNLFEALDQFQNASVVFTKPNSDAGGRAISEAIDLYVSRNSSRAYAFTSLGQLRYLSLLRWSDVVVGNSSSGIIEAPYFGVPTVNIGDRQKGRAAASSIIHCQESQFSIAQAISQALSPEFKEIAAATKPLYGAGNTAPRIKEQLKAATLETILRKPFFNLNQETL